MAAGLDIAGLCPVGARGFVRSSGGGEVGREERRRMMEEERKTGGKGERRPFYTYFPVGTFCAQSLRNRWYVPRCDSKVAYVLRRS